VFELSLRQELDPGPKIIPDPARSPMTVEPHSHDNKDRLEGWRLNTWYNDHAHDRYPKQLYWVVVIRDKPVAISFKRQWARELIRDLKVAWVHDQ
jgi:hypothetical protein